MRASAGRVADPRLFVNCSLHGSPAPGEARRASWPAYLPTPRDRNRPNSRYGNVFFLFFFSWLIRKKKKKAKIAISFRKKRNLERDDAAQCCSMIGHHMIRVLDFNFCRIEACFYQRSANISRRVLFLDEKLRERKRKEEKRKKGDDRAVNAVSLSLLLARERFNFFHLSASR